MKRLEEMFAHTDRLPTIPELVRELVMSFEDPQVDTRTLADKIAMDQVLTARVLRLANSARFGLPRQVGTLSDAMLVLGFNSLRTLVVASGLAGALKGPPGIDLKAFWRLCAATAGYASWLAKQAKQREDLAFTGGLILHIGVLLIETELPDEAAVIRKVAVTGSERAAVEVNVLGFTHADVGAELATRWNFPPSLTDAFKSYPDPLSAAEFNPMSALFNLADRVATAALSGATAGLADVLPGQLLDRLGLSAEHILANMPPLDDAMGGLDALLD